MKKIRLLMIELITTTSGRAMRGKEIFFSTLPLSMKTFMLRLTISTKSSQPWKPANR